MLGLVIDLFRSAVEQMHLKIFALFKQNYCNLFYNVCIAISGPWARCRSCKRFCERQNGFCHHRQSMLFSYLIHKYWIIYFFDLFIVSSFHKLLNCFATFKFRLNHCSIIEFYTNTIESLKSLKWRSLCNRTKKNKSIVHRESLLMYVQI